MTVLEVLKEDAVPRLTDAYSVFAHAAAPYAATGADVPPLIFWQKAAIANMVYLLKKEPLEDFLPTLRTIVKNHYMADKSSKAALEWYQQELTIWESVIAP